MVNGPQGAVLLIGPTASGKTPLGDLIAREGINGLHFHHFDFGEQLRCVSSGGEKEFTRDEVTFVKRVLEEGLLLEDEQFHLAKKIIRSFLVRKNVPSSDMLVMNGLPRHEGQARMMEDIVRVRAVFVLECGDDAVIKRIEENTGGDREGREDDHQQLVMKKVSIFRERTVPLISFYRERGADIVSVCVDEGAGPDTVYRELLLRYDGSALTSP